MNPIVEKCSTCGALIGEECWDARTGWSLPMRMFHKSRIARAKPDTPEVRELEKEAGRLSPAWRTK